ncbi:PAM68 family protein [Synechococcus sp. EJ6-Ellesmere]|uniref:PAM68 family protein n=1 Tax=Synechococcus sp. EJ6-Ellesmere TaxID=2823734 RepID=UPI0020CEA994|nr:PAM68 family protein [Synechococcus sp. EJ6-Ellesmere]MCP9825362.1 PAM68 family protein [Synechococcus sp. EJ6-Ellesmere]
MAAKRKPLPFEPERQPRAGATAKAGTTARSGSKAQPRGSQVIPPAVANRMARRIGVATGIPSVLGMGVFIGSYLLVSRGILDVPPVVTLASSGGLFLLGVLGLSYGVLSASWEQEPGTLLGTEQIGTNIARMKASIKAIRQGSGSGA